MNSQIGAIVIVALTIGNAFAGENVSTGGFEHEWRQCQELYTRLSEAVIAKRIQERGPTSGYLHAQQSLNNLASRLNSASETALSLTSALQSKDRAVQSAAMKAVLSLTAQLRSQRERTARDADTYLRGS
jgi:hypothetical protein